MASGAYVAPAWLPAPILGLCEDLSNTKKTGLNKTLFPFGPYFIKVVPAEIEGFYEVIFCGFDTIALLHIFQKMVLSRPDGKQCQFIIMPGNRAVAFFGKGQFGLFALRKFKIIAANWILVMKYVEHGGKL